MPDSIRVDVEAYLENIKRVRQRTRYTASVSLGGQLDSNVGAAPQSNTSLFFDTPVTVDRAESDFSYVGFSSIRVDHDLGYREGHSVFAALSYFHDEKTAEDSQDLRSFMAEGGGVYRDWFEGGDLTAKLRFNQVGLSRETFLHEYGGALRYDRQLYTDLTGFVGADLSHQSYSPIFENSTSEERNGRLVSGSAGIAYTISPEHRITVEVKLLDKNAKGAVPTGGTLVEEFFSYLRQEARINHTWLLGDGQFLLNSFTFQRDRYDDPDSFISIRKRRDNIIRLCVTYGAPLSFLTERLGVGLWEPLEDITFTPSIEYTRSQSNLENFDYNNWKIQGLLTKSWSF